MVMYTIINVKFHLLHFASATYEVARRLVQQSFEPGRCVKRDRKRVTITEIYWGRIPAIHGESEEQEGTTPTQTIGKTATPM